MNAMEILEKSRKKGFDQGYICAIACIVAGHGASTETREALKCNMPKTWKHIAEYDIKILQNNGLIDKEMRVI